MSKKLKCRDCKFFDYNRTICRRYPPIMLSFNGTTTSTAAYPVVSEHSWCGEHYHTESDLREDFDKFNES